jgi:hypothetical protein
MSEENFVLLQPTYRVYHRIQMESKLSAAERRLHELMKSKR